MSYNCLSKQNRETKNSISRYQIYPFCYYYTGTTLKITTKKFMVWIQNRKGKIQIKTIMLCQQHPKEITVQINVKDYCEMLHLIKWT